MPKSFLLKRFAKDSEWKGSNAQGNDECISECIKKAPGWDSYTLGMEWNTMHPQKQPITTQPVYPDTSNKPNKHEFVNHMIYRDTTIQLIDDEKRPAGYNSNRTGNIKAESAAHKKQPYKCGQCGKVFKTKYTLTIHLKMPSHTGARPFVCAICGKGFRLSSTLCRHKIIHTSNKPHRCKTCGKAFNRSSTLKTHQRTHSDTKEFTCHICNKGFHQKGNLRNHLLIHSGEKPYKCSLCKKAFNKLSNLKFHVHVHTDNKPYRCRLCKDSFSRRCELKEHISNCGQKVIDKSLAAGCR